MQKPQAAPPEDRPRHKSSAEFFGLAEVPLKTAPDISERPDWFMFLADEGLGRDFKVWFDAWPSVLFFLEMDLDSQWRHGFDGITGMDYSAVIDVIGLYYVDNAERVQVFEDVKAFGNGALFAVRELRKKAADEAEAERKRNQGKQK